MLTIFAAGGAAFAAPELAAPERQSKFAPLRSLLEGWELTTEFAVSVGTSEGERFRYEGGSFTMQTQVPTASVSKWPSAMMFAGLVADGTISTLDTRVNTILPYWTKDASDPRSAITLRMLLTFTSGFGDGHPGLEANTRAAHAWRAANPAELARANASRRRLLVPRARSRVLSLIESSCGPASLLALFFASRPMSSDALLISFRSRCTSFFTPARSSAGTSGSLAR